MTLYIHLHDLNNYTHNNIVIIVNAEMMKDFVCLAIVRSLHTTTNYGFRTGSWHDLVTSTLPGKQTTSTMNNIIMSTQYTRTVLLRVRAH